MRGLIDGLSAVPIVVAGVVVVAAGALSDPITDLLGISNESGFGWKQAVVLAFGVALLAAGVALAAAREE